MNLAIFSVSKVLGTLKKTLAASSEREVSCFKGKPRPYLEAKELLVIDERIEKLVDTLNWPHLIRTIGSCEGHGWGFIKSSPYVSFKCDKVLAATLVKSLHAEMFNSASRLNYFWEISAHFDFEFDLTYSLSVPGIMSGRRFYATRNGIDHDLAIIESLFKKQIFDHLKGQELKFKCQKNTDTNNNQNEHHVESEFIARTLSTKGISRIATITLFSCCAQWFLTVNALIQCHVYSVYISLKRRLIVSYAYKKLEIYSITCREKYIRNNTLVGNLCDKRSLRLGQKTTSHFKAIWREMKC